MNTNAKTSNTLTNDVQSSLFAEPLTADERWSIEKHQWEFRLAEQSALPLVERNPNLIFLHDKYLDFLRATREKKQMQRVSEKAIQKTHHNDLLKATDIDVTNQVTHYGSGVLTPAYWEAYCSIGHPVCVTAAELGSTGLSRVCDYLRQGGTVLMDSGAFLYREDFGAMPWAKVEQVYRAVSEAASKGQKTTKVTFILPDAVGSQSGSLAALREWGARIQAAIGPTHERLLPIQRGSMTPTLYIEAAIAALGNSPISGIAVPCKAKAFPAEHLSDLKNTTCDIPRRVHLLGLSGNRKKLATYLLHLNESWPGATVSCDAVLHRAAVGEREIITRMRQEIIEGPISEMVERLVDLTDPLDDAEENQAESLCNAHPGMCIQSARHQIVKNFLLAEWGAWATKVATKAYLTGVEPNVLTSYWYLMDAMSTPP